MWLLVGFGKGGRVGCFLDVCVVVIIVFDVYYCVMGVLLMLDWSDLDDCEVKFYMMFDFRGMKSMVLCLF